jgi:hypothetical protein
MIKTQDLEELYQVNMQNFVDMRDEDRADKKPAAVNQILPAMGSSLQRPIDTKKAKKLLKDDSTAASNAAALQGMEASLNRIVVAATKKQRLEGLKLQYDVFKVLGDIEEARAMAEQIRDLNSNNTRTEEVVPEEEV